MKSDGPEQNRSQSIYILCVEVIPHLTVAIEHAATVDIDILAAQLEERGCVLVNLFEAVRLPVIGVICPLNIALND